ncbi:hypothetical protein LTR85_005906 [Meristemomyces frigidus]|nr:hypothetical protein LTR85_005906 [Meristemomyces frigidus]
MHFFGVCPQTMQIFTNDDLHIETPNVVADQTRYVIRDFCADAHFSTRPYVTGFPFMRSYAEVPLTSQNGFVIGSYCVVDDKPRDYGDNEIAILNEVAACIMTHLDLLKTRLEFQRVEGLVRGIGSYVAGYSGLQEQQTKNLPTRAFAAASNTDHGEPRLLRPHLTREKSSSGLSTGSLSSSTKSSRPPRVFSEPESAHESFSPRDGSSRAGAPWESANERKGSDVLISRDIRTAFTRASNLVTQSMEMQQVSFLDARRLESKKKPIRSAKLSNSTPTSITDSDTDSPRCITLDDPTGTQGNEDPDSTTIVFDMRESLLQRMLTRYPFGHIFSYDDLGVISHSHLRNNHQDRMHPSRPDFGIPSPLDTDSEEADSATLFSAVTHARSIIFLPLWDFQSDKWFAAAIGWTTDPTRILDLGDLNYLSAFGNSIMAEVSRLETSALSRAKSDFISSVSHELRSPLHGILAGTELLRKAQTSDTDESMLDTIESCGNMLLDTIDHLLDFAKINSLTSKGRQSSIDGSSPATDSTLTRLAVVDLGELVQDVVEGVRLGYSRPTLKHAADVLVDRTSRTSPDAAGERKTGLDNTIVCVNIEPAVDWHFDSEAGAWKRIVMNLFGNALKYTARGRIDVILRLVDQLDDSPDARKICIQVNDTGMGMSADYLQHRLFTPFAQENHLSVGTGLGLSIVYQLVSSLGGSVDVQSELEKGTQICVTVPLGDKVRAVSAERRLRETSGTTRVPLDRTSLLKGRTLYLPRPDSASVEASPPTSETWNESNQATDVQTLFANIAERSFGMDVSFENPPTFASGQPHFVLQQPRDRNKPDWTLRLCSPAPAVPSEEEAGATPVEHGPAMNVREVEVSIGQPFGPRKLALAFAQALTREGRQQPTLNLLHTNSQLPALTSMAGHVVLAAPSTHTEHAALPLRVPHSPERAPELSSTQTSAPGHLLLVDDNNLNLRVLSMCVKQIGCTFAQAMDGLQAVAAYKATTRPYDLVFMDLSMPRMDGCAATRDIRAYEAREAVPRTPIVALTALGADEARQEAFASGVDLFLSKPVSMSEVRALVARFVARRGKDAQAR